MTYEELIPLTGVQVQGGSFYGGEDFGGPAWILDFIDNLTCIVRIDDREVCYVECLNIEDDKYYYYMPEQFANLSLSEQGSIRKETLEEVFDIWHKNKENAYVTEYREEFSDDEAEVR